MKVGTRKPCTAWTKLFLFDVQHHAWTRIGFTLLCTVKSGGDAVEVLTRSGAETVLYEFIREEAKQVVVHEFVLEAS